MAKLKLAGIMDLTFEFLDELEIPSWIDKSLKVR